MRPERSPTADASERAPTLRDGGVTVLETLTVLAGCAALALAPGISREFVVAAVALLVLWTVARGAFGWSVPPGAARLVNLLFVVYVLVSIVMTSSQHEGGDDLATVRTFAHDLILFLVLHTLQRRTFRSVGLRLLGATGCFALAVELTTNPMVAPLILVGLVNGAGAAMLLVLARARAESEGQRRLGRTERIEASRRPWLAAVSGLFVALRLSVLLLLGTVAIYVLIPRRIEPGTDGPRDGAARATASVAGGTSRAGGTSGVSGQVLSLDSIGRIKRDTRAAYDVSTREGVGAIVMPHDLAYFRTSVYAAFDGRRWFADSEAATHDRSMLSYRLGPPRGIGPRLTQTFLVRLPVAAGAGIPSLYRPFVVTTEGGLDLGPLSERTGGVLAFDGAALRPGDRFHVASALRADDGRDPSFAPLSAPEWRLYTDTSGAPRLAAIARSIVRGASGAEALARLQAWYQDPGRFRYTLDVPDYGPRPLEMFLNPRGRRGHCELFASSFAMLGRHAGVPTRLVAGFRPAPTRSDRFSLYNSDAHAWVEAWTSDRGWVVHDPTPAAELSHSEATGGAAGDDGAAEETSGFVDRLVGIDRVTQDRWFSAARERIGAIQGGHVAAAAIALLALGALAVALRRREREAGDAPARAPPRPLPAADGARSVRRTYLAMLTVLGRRGWRRAVGETPRELACRVAGASDAGAPPATDAVRELTALFEAVRYAGRSADARACRRATELLRTVERARGKSAG